MLAIRCHDKFARFRTALRLPRAWSAKITPTSPPSSRWGLTHRTHALTPPSLVPPPSCRLSHTPPAYHHPPSCHLSHTHPCIATLVPPPIARTTVGHTVGHTVGQAVGSRARSSSPLSPSDSTHLLTRAPTMIPHRLPHRPAPVSHSPASRLPAEPCRDH